MAEAINSVSSTVQFEDFAKLDLCVGTILQVVPVANADKLVELTVDLGELGQRTIVAGIKLHYSEAQLINRQIVVVTNLEPRKMRGVMSHGMLLAASDATGLSLLSLDKPMTPGSRIQ